MIFTEVLRATRGRAPDATALVFGERHWTYAELDDATDRLAAGLCAAGVRRDDRVAFFMPNCPELLFSYLACFRLGAIAVPLNHRYRAAEAQYAIVHSGATTLIVHADKRMEAQAALGEPTAVERTYLVDPVSHAAQPAAPWRAFAELLAAGDARPPAPDFDERQLATIMYTSGTTARPKGVVHSQGTLWQCVQIQAESMQFTAADVHLVSTSASHCAATYGQLFPNIHMGGTAVMLDDPSPADVVAAIQKHRVTRCQMLPASLQDLVEYLEAHPTRLASLRSFCAGGDAVPLTTHERFRAQLGFDVAEVCGMTETVTYSVNPPFGEKRLGSVGLPVARTQVRIVDPRRRELAAGEVGEIEIRSPSNMVGYWNDTLHTAATLDGGWLASGDLGRLDPQGYLWFVGRKKEIIIRGGSNISPAEIEEVIDQHPAVHLSGVVGLADPHWGQVVVAYVALRDDARPAPTVDELRAFVAGRIAAYKVPERFFVLPNLPTGATGKVDRQQLHARVEADARGGDASATTAT